MSKIAVNEITNEAGTGGPTLPNGIDISSEVFTFNEAPRFCAIVTLANDSFAEIVTPNINSGFVFLQRRRKSDGFPNGSEGGVAFLDWGDSPGTGAYMIASGGRFNFSSNGEPTGTSGSSQYATIFQGGPPETFYLENRTGNSDTFVITIL